MAVYRITDILTVTGKELQMLIMSLPQWRREKALKYKIEQGQRECCLSYLLLCDLLRQEFGITEQPVFVIGEHGKPMLTGCSGNISFNMSHCKRAVACVASDYEEVGVDVECTGRYTTSLADYCMNEEEKKAISEAEDPDMAFTVIWTRKEALLKLTGEGITDDFKSVLKSDRMEGVTIESHSCKEKGYAWSIARRKR